MTGPEDEAFRVYLQTENQEFGNAGLKVVRWARIRLPNGQIARSLCKEAEKPLNKLRMARNVK
ncbi:hypothetical protein H0H92_002395, partial [Tricholoma furcatifolium]